MSKLAITNFTSKKKKSVWGEQKTWTRKIEPSSATSRPLCFPPEDEEGTASSSSLAECSGGEKEKSSVENQPIRRAKSHHGRVSVSTD